MKEKLIAGLGLALVIIVALVGYDQLNSWMQKRKLAAAAAASGAAAGTAETEA